MKRCMKCRIEKELGFFYLHAGMADGHLNKCKDCTKNDVKKYQKANVESVREYEKKRSLEPHRVAARYEYSQTIRGRNVGNKAKQTWILRNPRKRAAQILFRNRQRYDVSLHSRPCLRCGEEKTHGHHENYDKPLEVVWLCPAHHKQRHKEMKAHGIEP
jgi:hypothetical protein